MVGPAHARAVDAALDLARNEVVRVLPNGTLHANTKPNVQLYPFQWNWDSAIVANAFSDMGVPLRGLDELRSLHAAQHETGLLPHIAFSSNAHDLSRYFPGPDVWGSLHGLDGRPISGITQPPVSGIALRSVVEAGVDANHPEVRQLINRIHDHHKWWMRERNPAGDGNVVVLHGWSTGRDNAPEVLDLYNAADMPARVGVGALRKDLGHGVPAASRPTNEYYEHSVGIADRARELGGWTRPGLAKHMPFMLADPMVGSLLAGSASDLATIAKHSGMSRVADESTEIATAISNALARRVTTNGTIHAVDMRHERLLDNHLTIATPMTAWAPGISDEALLRNAQLVHHGNLAGNHGVLTASTDNAWFDAQRYWQGPTWPHMDELVARGLERSASEPGRPAAVRDAVAEAVGALDARTRAAITRDASPEYRHAISGETVGKTHMSFSSGSLLMHARRTGNSGLDDAASAYEAASNWRPIAPR